MTLCLITDRRRLGAAVGAGPTDWLPLLERQVRAAAESGIDLIQIREPDLDGQALWRLVGRLVAACRGASVQILVNDRLDIALAAGAAGVHLKERSFTCQAARRMAPAGFLVGRSLHGPGSIAELREADYLIAGTIQATPSKPGAPLLGWEGLSAVVLAAGDKPVLGIGGLDLASIPLLAATGAAGLAAISAFIPSDGEELVKFVQKRAIDMRLAFDSVRSVP